MRIPGYLRLSLNAWAFIALAAWFTPFDVRAEDIPQLGHGIDVGPLNFAGYSNLVVSVPNHGEKSLTLDDLSLFVTGHITSYFNPFVEAELTHVDLARSTTPPGENHSGDVILERIYNDVNLTDSVTFRIGKMLTPVGEWNQIHAAPLVPTTVRPAVTHRNFSEYATGISFLYTDPAARYPDLQVYWQPDGELSDRPTSIVAHRYKDVEGAHLSFPLGLLDKVGFSFQRSKDTRGMTEILYGMDFHYTIQRVTFQGEWTRSDVSGPRLSFERDNEWGAYFAVSYSLTDRWSLFSWYEGFTDRTTTSPAHDLLFGFAYRPHPAIVLKLEYLQNVGGPAINPTGLFGSWSVLF